MDKGLTEKQKRFVEEYLIDLNATRAYKVAYPSVKRDETAAAAAARMLRNVKVSEYIAKRQDDLQRRTEITQERVLQELAAIAFSKATDYAHVVEKKVEISTDNGPVPVLDQNGDPVLYRTIELELTENLNDTQKAAVASMKKGRDGLEVKTHDKLKALELLGRHIGMFGGKTDLDMEEQRLRIAALKEKTGEGERSLEQFEQIVNAAGGRFETKD